MLQLTDGKKGHGNDCKQHLSIPITLESPTKEGYNFIGWQDENGNDITSINVAVLRNIELYANWSEIE